MIGLREDQQLKAQLVARINLLFPVVRLPVVSNFSMASGLPLVKGLSVVSGLAPRWAAQQPQNQPPHQA